MRRVLLGLLMLALAPAALADELPATVTGDLDGDGVADKAVLSANAQDPDTVDLTVTLSGSKRTVRAVGFTSAQDVTTPVIAKGELHLSFGWYQGRYKWSSDFFIGLQGKDLIVRRYEFHVADSIEADAQGRPKSQECAADFVAGRATRNGQPAKPPGPPVLLEKWSDSSAPEACQF